MLAHLKTDDGHPLHGLCVEAYPDGSWPYMVTHDGVTYGLRRSVAKPRLLCVERLPEGKVGTLNGCGYFEDCGIDEATGMVCLLPVTDPNKVWGSRGDAA